MKGRLTLIQGYNFHLRLYLPSLELRVLLLLLKFRQEMVKSTITLLKIILQTKHQVDWDSATCITYSTEYFQRLTLESWFTNLEQTSLNRNQQHS